MLLRVDPKRMFWGYDGFWFTSDDVDPQEINLDNMGSETKEKFTAALDEGILVEVDTINLSKGRKLAPKPRKKL